MATITTVSHGSYPQTPRRSYFTTSNYDTQFFGLYSNLNTTTYQPNFFLSTVQGASSAVCNSNAYLRETGKKIYPGQYSGVNSYYVSVFDDRTHLTGFINPNNALFLPLNTDKPLNILNELSTTGTSDDVNAGNYGPPVNTKGTINSVGYISTQSYLHVNDFALVDQYISSGIYMTAGTYVAGASVTLNTVTGGAANGNVYVNPTRGNVFNVSITTGYPTNTNTLFMYIGTGPSAPILPPAGERITIVFNGLATGSYYTVDLGNTSVTAGQITVNQQRYMVVPVNTTETITYISNGANLIETSRSSSGGGTSGGSAIVSYGSVTGTGASSYTISTPYATSAGKIFLVDQSTRLTLSVTGVVAGVSFTVTCYGLTAGQDIAVVSKTLGVVDNVTAIIPSPTAQNTSGIFNWMIIA